MERALVKSFLPDGFIASRKGLRFAKDLTEENFFKGCEIITQLARFSHESLPYIIGDMVNLGDDRFENKYEQFVDITGLEVGVLRNYAWMCRKVPQEAREHSRSVMHSMVVATMPLEKQIAALKRANDENLNASELRRIVKGDPNYKRHALPKDGSTKRERLLKSFEPIWQQHEREWMSCATMKDLAKKVYEFTINLYPESL